METGLSNRTTRTFQRAIAAGVGASALLLAGTAQAALEDRDLDGDMVVDAFYDTDLDITWLRDANVNGKMTWDNAVAWADGFTFAGYDDWRLPTSEDDCVGYCAGSEMCHLFHVGLGNAWGSNPANTGDFQNAQKDWYWSSTVVESFSEGRMVNRVFFVGDQSWNYPSATFYALAVRPGDVPAVPEPRTVVLLLAGLATLALAGRQQPR